MHEQRTANAAIASPPHDPTNARSEAPLLELSPIPVWPPEKAVSVPSLGFGITHVRLLDTASIRPSRVDARTVNYSDSCVRQSPFAGNRTRPRHVVPREFCGTRVSPNRRTKRPWPPPRFRSSEAPSCVRIPARSRILRGSSLHATIGVPEGRGIATQERSPGVVDSIPNPVTVGRIKIGKGQPLTLIAGPCVMEPGDLTMRIASRLVKICDALAVPLVFKASYDKANRTSVTSYRGPGLDAGMKVFARIKAETGLQVTTDIHETHQAAPLAEVVDLLQV